MSDELTKHLTHSKKLSEIELNFNSKPLDCGFPSIKGYEYLMSGEGNLLVIAATPGSGKTALSAQIAVNVAKHSKVLFFSLEMRARALKKRLLAVTSGIPANKITDPAFSKRLPEALKDQENLKLHIIDDKGLTIDDILSKSYDENSIEKVALVVVDYLGIINYKEGTAKHAAIGKAAQRLKDELADKLKIPVIALSQMKEGFEYRYLQAKMEYEKAKQFPTGANSKILEVRPGLDDIAESKDITRAADNVLFLHRPWLLNRDEDHSRVIVYGAKQRDGMTQDFELEFSGSLTKFTDRGII